MDNSVSSRDLEVKYAGVAIEYGTLTLLMESLVQQRVLEMPFDGIRTLVKKSLVQRPVLVIPLERSIQHGSLTIFQWMIHVTTRADEHRPIAYATFRAAEVKQTISGQTLTFPTLEEWVAHPKERARQLQQQFLACVITLLEQCPQVSQVVVPARHRLPDEWVWSARGTDEHIGCRDGAWVLLER